MPRKKRQLKQDLRRAGFTQNKDRGKGSHATWRHHQFPDVRVMIAGQDGDDARHYDERNVREAIAEVERRLAVS
jgi:predicted RNA binding protein YcfA (HicA-like mRNA interferase family)